MAQSTTSPPDGLEERLAYFKSKHDAYVSPMDVKRKQDTESAQIQLVDVRVGPPDRLSERIPGSIHIPQTEIRERIDEIQNDAEIILYCWASWCSLATKAAIPLLERGFDVTELYGGIAAWNTLELPTESVEPKSPPQELNSDDKCDC